MRVRTFFLCAASLGVLAAPALAQPFNRGIQAVYFDRPAGPPGFYYIRVLLYAVNGGTGPADLSMKVDVVITGTNTRNDTYLLPLTGLAQVGSCSPCLGPCSLTASVSSLCLPLDAATCGCATQKVLLAGMGNPYELDLTDSVSITVSAAPSAIGPETYTTDDSQTFAPINSCHCYLNCDGSTLAPVINVLDFMCFDNLWATSANPAYTDCDGDGQKTINDYMCFLNTYASTSCACP